MPRALAGVVLCGGASRRMGTDKALLRPAGDGPPLYVRVAERLGRVADPVMLAPGRASRLGETGYAEVNDALGGSGPLSGLVAALEAAPHPLLAVVAVDMPLVSPEILRLLAERCGDHEAAVAMVGGRPEPLHAVYARAALPVLAALLGEGRLGLRAALGSLDVCRVTSSDWRQADPAGTFATNLNSVADLAGWRAARSGR